ncbi:hypothetical protein PMIN03_005531 [Paraphaeosphaeria minitans]
MSVMVNSGHLYASPSFWKTLASPSCTVMSTPFLPCPQDPAHQRRPNLTRHRGIHLVARRPRTAPSSANNNDKRAGLGRSTNAEMQPWDPVECRTGDVYDAVSITGAARVLDGARGVRLCGRASRDCRSHWGAWGVRTGQTFGGAGCGNNAVGAV